MEMAQLLGPGVLGDLMRGRYHQPRRENRLFVFFDMRGSTAIAERIGDVAFHRLLNRFFIDLTEAVLPWHGIVHKYVGDEMIRSEEHTSELQSLMRISYAVFCLQKKTTNININITHVIPEPLYRPI